LLDLPRRVLGQTLEVLLLPLGDAAQHVGELFLGAAALGRSALLAVRALAGLAAVHALLLPRGLPRLALLRALSALTLLRRGARVAALATLPGLPSLTRGTLHAGLLALLPLLAVALLAVLSVAALVGALRR